MSTLLASSATYTKLRDGSWGIRSTSPVTAGQTVTVTTKAGIAKSETVSRVLWQGSGVWLCSVAQRARPVASSYRRGDGGPRADRACYMCGSYYCDGARGYLCEED